LKLENIVDTHAHTWSPLCRYEKEGRYIPSKHLSINEYISILDKYKIKYGVLVQPSFLGHNNSYLIRCLRAYRKRLRGVIVFDFSNPHLESLRKLANLGVVGVRFNLNGKVMPDISSVKYDKLFNYLKKLDWFIQVTAKEDEWLKIMPKLLHRNVKIVVDHFGKPEKNAGINGDGFKAIIEATKTKNVWIKFSAPYRFGCIRASLYANELVEHVSKYRILWGSDYPFTRHSSGRSYKDFIDMFSLWFPDKTIREYATYKNAISLYKFNTSVTSRLK
jgi:predicted TIM-barrel fold metal-dependent hydrolase